MRNTFAVRVATNRAAWGGDGFETVATYPTLDMARKDAGVLVAEGFEVETWDNEAERLHDHHEGGGRAWTGSLADWALIDA